MSRTVAWELPPLILHPFNERVPPATLLENSKAALMLSGIIPNDGTEESTLNHRLMSGRYTEFRMLFFLGKDVVRWIGQCLEWSLRVGEFGDAGISPQSFASLLTSSPPETVKQKLTTWGVADHGTIFSRAIGLNAVFIDPPAVASLNEDFLRNYHRYADQLFRCYMDSQSHQPLKGADFRFDLYASGEYSRMLANEWS